jgi:phospholipid-binding lipoprotein MlaA
MPLDPLILPLRRAALVLALCCAGCATPPTDPEALIAHHEANDPLEPTNRVMFERNRVIDRNVLKPAAKAYVEIIPDGVRHGVHNVLANLKEPLVAVNHALQGNFDLAWTTLRRFAVNSTAGALGIFDVASGWDLPRREADFGQTFGVWGIDEGPYLMLPLLGPSNPRDAAGTLLTFLLDPLDYLGLAMLDRRSRHLADLDEIERNSLDYYATLRSLYRQRRAALVDQAKGASADAAAVPAQAD